VTSNRSIGLFRVLRPLSAVGLAFTLFATVASSAAKAQVPAASVKTDAPPEGAPPVLPPEGAPLGQPPVPVVSPDLAARLDEIEPLARIAARKHELLEEEAAKKAKESVSVVTDDKGTGFKSGDGSYTLKIHGLVQSDGRFLLGDDVLQDKDTFLIRRFRPSLDGTLFGLVDYRFVPDFAGSQVQVFDAYVDIHPFDWLRFRAGKFKAPIGLERLQADPDLSFVERSLDQNLSTTRDAGLLLWGDVAGGIVNYALGVVNGGADGTNADVDTNHAKDFVGRLFFQPVKSASLSDWGSLGLGIAGSTGERKGLPPQGTTAAAPGLPSFRTFGQNTFFQYLAPGSDPSGTGTTFAHLRASRLNPQLYYYVGPLGIQAEYIVSRQSVQKGNDQATLDHKAAHATASFVFNGRNGYDGATPLVPFDRAKGAWGAVEVAFRYGWLKLDPHTFADAAVPASVAYANKLTSARQAQSLGVAVNYVPRRSFRLALAFERTLFDGGAVAADKKTEADRKTEDALIGRAQVNF